MEVAPAGMPHSGGGPASSAAATARQSSAQSESDLNARNPKTKSKSKRSRRARGQAADGGGSGRLTIAQRLEQNPHKKGQSHLTASSTDRHSHGQSSSRANAAPGPPLDSVNSGTSKQSGIDNQSYGASRPSPKGHVSNNQGQGKTTWRRAQPQQTAPWQGGSPSSYGRAQQQKPHRQRANSSQMHESPVKQQTDREDILLTPDGQLLDRLTDVLAAKKDVEIHWTQYSIGLNWRKCRQLSYLQLVIAFLDRPNRNPKLKAKDRSFWLLEALMAPSASNQIQVHETITQTIQALEEQMPVSKDMPPQKEPVSKGSLPFLAREQIFVLSKSTRFPYAVYHCRACDYHLSSITQARTHVNNDEHRITLEQQVLVECLRALPRVLSVPHVNALDQYLHDLVNVQARPVTHMNYCAQLAATLTTIVQSRVHPECSVRVYGSCQSGVALRESNVNLELLYPPNVPSFNHAHALMKTHQVLTNVDGLCNVKDEFTIRCPRVRFECVWYAQQPDAPHSLECHLSVNNQLAYEIGTLISVYTRLRPEIVQLMQLARVWAKLCGIVEFETGGWPAYTTDLLCVHYLQNAHYLPVLHRNTHTQDTAFDVHDYETDDAVIQLRIANECTASSAWNTSVYWIGLLQYYVLHFKHNTHVIQIRQLAPIDRESKNWNRKKYAIEGSVGDPFMLSKNISQLTPRMFEYISYCMRTTYEYLAVPQSHDGPLFVLTGHTFTINPVYSDRLYKLCAVRGVPSVELESASATSTVSSTTTSTSTATATVSSESSSVNEPDVEPDVEPLDEDTIDAADGSDQDRVDSDSDGGAQGGAGMLNWYTPDDIQRIGRASQQPLDAQLLSKLESLQLIWEQSPTKARTDKPKQLSSQPATTSVQLNTRTNELLVRAVSSLMSVTATESLPLPDISHCTLSTTSSTPTTSTADSALSTNKSPDRVCTYCAGAHLVSACPEKMLPSLCPLPPSASLKHQQILTNMLLMINQHLRDTPQRQNFQHNLCNQLQQLLVNRLEDCRRLGCRIDLFGSSFNGFVFDQSDFDICLRFAKGIETLPKDIEQKRIIRRIARILSREGRGIYRDVWPVTNAKVPIVKFKIHEQEGDISLYNVLALRNTQLLQTYAAADKRVPVLGRMLKYWAKKCDIGDASKGSLSSYAHILMLIHFLQRTQPPVLPCLQQIGERPALGDTQFMYDNHDTYFCCDVQLIQQLQYTSHNHLSIGQLWIELLRFYTEHFQFESDVVQIRRLESLSKFEKLWTDKAFCVEDPFDHNHNLASGLSKRMFSHIRRTFIHARETFGKDELFMDMIKRNSDPHGKCNLEFLADCVLNRCATIASSAPQERVCRHCHRAGHYQDTCPRRAQSSRFLDDSQSENEGDQSVDQLAENTPKQTHNQKDNQRRPAGGASSHGLHQQHHSYNMHMNTQHSQNVMRVAHSLAEYQRMSSHQTLQRIALLPTHNTQEHNNYSTASCYPPLRTMYNQRQPVALARPINPVPINQNPTGHLATTSGMDRDNASLLDWLTQTQHKRLTNQLTALHLPTNQRTTTTNTAWAAWEGDTAECD